MRPTSCPTSCPPARPLPPALQVEAITSLVDKAEVLVARAEQACALLQVRVGAPVCLDLRARACIARLPSLCMRAHE